MFLCCKIGICNYDIGKLVCKERRGNNTQILLLPALCLGCYPSLITLATLPYPYSTIQYMHTQMPMLDMDNTSSHEGATPNVLNSSTYQGFEPGTFATQPVN